MSIVIPTHHRDHSLKRTLESVLRHCEALPFESEVLVIRSDLPKRTFSSTTKVKVNEVVSDKTGVNSKRNLGLILSSAPITLFLDDDCEVQGPDFFLRHVKHHSDPNTFIVGGSYANIYSGRVAKAYAENYSSWLQASIAEDLPIVGGNLSMKTGLDSPWMRFDESISFGGSEREMISRLKSQKIKCEFVTDLQVNHHISMTIFEFVKKAFLQGVTEGRFEHLAAGKAVSCSGLLNRLYRFVFQIGLVFGFRFPQSKVTPFRLGICVLRLALKMDSRKMGTGPTFESNSWTSAFLSLPVWGRIRRLLAHLEVELYWKRLFKYYQKIKVTLVQIRVHVEKTLFWNFIFRIYTDLKRLVVESKLKLERLFFWNGIFPLFVFVRSNLWRLNVGAQRIFGTIAIVRGNLYATLIYGFWKLHRATRPFMLIVLKPYYFIKYQFDRRVFRSLR